jgi:hypothetical protein
LASCLSPEVVHSLAPGRSSLKASCSCCSYECNLAMPGSSCFGACEEEHPLFLLLCTSAKLQCVLATLSPSSLLRAGTLRGL